jgi:hypothetical protein
VQIISRRRHGLFLELKTRNLYFLRRGTFQSSVPYRLARQPKLSSYRSLILPLHTNRTTHPRIDLHRVHASGVPRQRPP